MDRNTKRTRYCRHHHATAVVNSRSQRNCYKVNCKVVRPAQFQADPRLAWVAAIAPINQRKTQIRFQIEKHFVSMQLHDPVDTRTITGRTYGLPELVIISVQCLSFVILEVVPLLLWSGVLSRLLTLPQCLRFKLINDWHFGAFSGQQVKLLWFCTPVS